MKSQCLAYFHMIGHNVALDPKFFQLPDKHTCLLCHLQTIKNLSLQLAPCLRYSFLCYQVTHLSFSSCLLSSCNDTVLCILYSASLPLISPYARTCFQFFSWSFLMISVNPSDSFPFPSTNCNANCFVPWVSEHFRATYS